MGAGDEDVTLGELNRSLLRIEAELRDAKTNYVPRLEFNEVRKAQGERLGNIEKDIAEIQGDKKRINYVAWTGVVLPILVTIIGALLIASLGLK